MLLCGCTVEIMLEPTDVEPGEAFGAGFIGNKNSMKFHASTCVSLPSEKNRIEFAIYQEAVGAGYIPCGGCIG